MSRDGASLRWRLVREVVGGSWSEEESDKRRRLRIWWA